MHWTRPAMTAMLAAFACTAAPPPETSPRSDPPAPSVPPLPATPPTPPTTPTPPAPPEPPATPPTATAAPATSVVPLSVYAAVIEGAKKKRWEVDIINFEGIDIGPLDKRLKARAEAREEEEEAEDLVVTFKRGAPGLPVGFSHGDPWTLITLEGVEQRSARGFTALVPAGSGTTHFGVDLGAPRAGAGQWALALRGHAPTSAALVVPQPIAPAALAPGTLGRVTRALVPGLEEDLRDRASKAKIAEEHVKLYPGRFPGGRSHVVFVASQTMIGEDDMVQISGVLFARPDGNAEFLAAASVSGSATLVALVDIDGDGLDEVLWDDQYHEGLYRELIYWKDGKPERRTLAGDGL